MYALEWLACSSLCSGVGPDGKSGLNGRPAGRPSPTPLLLQMFPGELVDVLPQSLSALLPTPRRCCSRYTTSSDVLH